MKPYMNFSYLLLALLVGGMSSFGQAPVLRVKAESEILKREISLPELRYSETSTILQKAFLRAHLSGGIVVVSCSEKMNQYAFSRPRISIQNLLFAVEQVDPEYRWEFSDGIINILPRQGIPELLEIRFREFTTRALTSDETLNALLGTPETRRKMADLGLDRAVTSITLPQSYDPDHSASRNNSRFDMDLRNVTFRQILNEIVKKSSTKTWQYTERHCGGETLFSVVLVG
jgi:hypothetical protein